MSGGHKKGGFGKDGRYFPTIAEEEFAEGYGNLLTNPNIANNIARTASATAGGRIYPEYGKKGNMYMKEDRPGRSPKHASFHESGAYHVKRNNSSVKIKYSPMTNSEGRHAGFYKKKIIHGPVARQYSVNSTNSFADHVSRAATSVLQQFRPARGGGSAHGGSGGYGGGYGGAHGGSGGYGGGYGGPHGGSGGYGGAGYSSRRTTRKLRKRSKSLKNH